MSRLQEILNPIKQKWLELLEKIQETELYQKIEEKYNSLTLRGQKMARIGIAFLFAGVLLYFPLSQFFASSDLITSFEEKRDLVRNLFQTYRQSSHQNHLPIAPDSGQLISQIQSQLSSSQLLPQQIKSVSSIEPDGKLIPKKMISHAVSVELSELNLRQAIEIGTQISNISSSIKLKDLIINASSGKTGYFDVVYKLYAFNTPQQPIEINSPEPENKKGKKKEKIDSEDSGQKKDGELTE